MEVIGPGLLQRRASIPATLFFCVRGFTADGHDFAPDAVERGAVALVCERPLGLGVPEVIVDDARAAMGPAAARFYGDPTAELRVVGITGTNGKTTTAFLVREVLEAAGMQTGLLGTVKQVVGGAGGARGAHHAGGDRPPGHLPADARRAATRRARWRCPRTRSSSAAPTGIRFACKVFTNLTQDHLDFHADMEAYYLAKRRLFDEPGPAVVNVDDAYGRRLAEELGDAVTYGIGRGELSARDVSFDVAGATFTVDTPDGAAPGVHAAARGCSTCRTRWRRWAPPRALGVELAGCRRRRWPRAGRVPGRFEPVEEGQAFGVLVDYAHTPDSLENVLRAARELTRGPPARGRSAPAATATAASAR